MPAFVTATWFKRAKLMPTSRPWSVEFRLLANGKRPTAITTSLRSTELWVRIAKDHYWVEIQHGGKRSSYVIHQSGDVKQPWSELALPAPKLATFGAWLAAAEAKIGKTFRRDLPWVKSNVKGGRDAIVRWIETAL